MAHKSSVARRRAANGANGNGAAGMPRDRRGGARWQGVNEDGGIKNGVAARVHRRNAQHQQA